MSVPPRVTGQDVRPQEALDLRVNGRTYRVATSPEKPLLWVLREDLGLTGTKYGCGRGLCGACSVHIDGRLVRSCVRKVGSVEGRTVTTIEGVITGSDHPVVRAWLEGRVSQCGYCQPGQIMAATALLDRNPRSTTEEIVSGMNGNLCRCGTYPRILRAITRAVAMRDE